MLSVSGFQGEDNQSDTTSNKALSLHNRTNCNEDSRKRFKCDICPHSTCRRSDLVKHLFVRSGAHPHTCEICKRGFSETGALELIYGYIRKENLILVMCVTRLLAIQIH